MLGSPAGPGGPSQRGGLWPLAPAPASTATSFTTPDGFNKYGVYSLFPGGPSLGSAIYSHSSTIAGRFTSGSIQPQTGGPFHTAHKISDSLFSTGYTFGAPTPPPGSPYSPVPVAQLEFLTKGFNSSNVITIQQPQQQQQQLDLHHQASTTATLTTSASTIPEQVVKKLQKFDVDNEVDDGKCCSDCFKQSKYCSCNLSSPMSISIDKYGTKLSNNKNTATFLQSVPCNLGSIFTGGGGCSRTNPVDWSGVNIKKEPGTMTMDPNIPNRTTMVPCQVAEITTSMSPMVKVEITSPTIHHKENNLTTPIVTTNGNIPVGIAVARQRIQHQEVVAASPSLPPAGLLTTVNTSTQIKEISRISELDHAGMAATSATGGGVHGGVHGGSTLLQCADDRTSALGNWPMCGTHNSALTTPTLWQYPAHLPVEPVVPVPVPPVGLQLVREPNTGHLLLLPTTGIEQAVVWPSYAAQPSPHVLFPPIPPPPLQLLSSSSSDYLATSTTLHQHTQTHHHSTRLVALTTDPKRKIPLQIPTTTTTLIKIETDPSNLDHSHHHHSHQQHTKTLQSVVSNPPVFTEQTTPLLTTHVIYQHPTNLILSSSTAQTNENQSITATSCRSQGTSPVTCLTPPPETLLNIAEEESIHTTFAVQDASNQTETPSCSGSEDDDNDKKLNDKKVKNEVNNIQETVIDKLTTKTKRNGSLEDKDTVRYQNENDDSACPDLSGLELLSNTIVVHEKNHVNEKEMIEEKVLEEEKEQLIETKFKSVITHVEIDDDVSKEDSNYNLVGLDLLCALAEQRIKEEGRDRKKNVVVNNKRRKSVEERSDGVKCKKLKLIAESSTDELTHVHVKQEVKTKPFDEVTFPFIKKIKLESTNKSLSNFQVNDKEPYREDSQEETDNDEETAKQLRRKLQENTKTSPNPKCRWKEENYRTYKTPESELEVKKYLASKSQTIYLQNDDFYYWPPCNTFEIEMRKQLADLQKKYKEKQKELNKLKPKLKQKNRTNSHNGEKKICEKSINSPTRSSTITPPPPILDKIEDLPPPKLCNNKISQDLLLKPPTLLRISTNEKTEKECPRRNETFEIKKSEKLPRRDGSLNSKKEEKILQKKHEKNERKERVCERSTSKEKELDKSLDQSEQVLEKDEKRLIKAEELNNEKRNEIFVKETLTSQIETSSSQKRKVGRPKKLISKQGLTIGTETIVAKKPKKNTLVGYLLAAKEQFLQERLYSTAATNSPPRYPEESIKIHRANKHNLKKKQQEKNKDKCKIRPKLKAEPTIKTYIEEEEEEENNDEPEDDEEPIEGNCNEPIMKGNASLNSADIYEDEEKVDEESDHEEFLPCDIEKSKKKLKNLDKKKKRKKQPRDKDVKAVVEQEEVIENLHVDDTNQVLTINNKVKEELEQDIIKKEEELPKIAQIYEEKLLVNEEIKEDSENRCTLTNEHLEIDKLRVLTAMGGLFYAGHLNAVQPPDVYSITLDGERGNRPHIMSREEILRDAIVEVSPTSTEELTPGTRLCAYWSQQYRCLYPGSVAEPGTPDPLLDSKFVSVEFDDGDSGRIALEDIRLLPTDYPIIEYDPNPLLSLSKRKRRTSASISTEERRICQQQQEKFSQIQQNKLKVKDDVMEKENKDVNKQEILLLGNNVSSATSTHLILHQQQQQQHREKKRMKKRKRDREKILKGTEENNKKRKRKHKCNENEEFCKHKRHHKKHRKHKKHHHQHEKNDNLEEDNNEVDSNGNKKNPTSINTIDKDNKKKSEEADIIKKPEIIEKSIVKEAVTIPEEEIVEDEEEEEVIQAEEEEEDDEILAKNEVTLDDILESKSKNSKKIRDRQESCESRSKMSAFLPARQLWGWSGKGYKRPRVKGRTRKLFYKAIQRGKETIMLGDSAVFLSTGRPDRPYIGRIEAMWEACGTMVVKVKWFYHPEETVGCPLNLQYPGALFESPHVDENDVQTISHKCEVLPLKEYKEKLGDDPQRYAAIYDNNDIYYLAGYYDPTTTTLKFQNGIPFTTNNTSQ